MCVYFLIDCVYEYIYIYNIYIYIEVEIPSIHISPSSFSEHHLPGATETSEHLRGIDGHNPVSLLDLQTFRLELDNLESLNGHENMVLGGIPGIFQGNL